MLASSVLTPAAFSLLIVLADHHQAGTPPAAPLQELTKIDGVEPRNVIFILTDDHRYDAMGFMDHPFLETPNMDRLAAGGVHFTAGYVTTSLCSPSRASILTGKYAHNHRIVDNNSPDNPENVYFPQYLQKAGYATGFFGKWHMGGHHDDPRPGFDRWVSFKGQGTYEPSRNGLNVDGERVPQKGYITDEMTDYCLEWMKTVPKDQPMFCYLSHKAVHAEFLPAPRHRGRYESAEVPTPVTQADTPENFDDQPRWVRDQRNSWHGVEYPYHTDPKVMDVKDYYRRYCETLLAVDESIGRVLKEIEGRGQLEETLVIYMGDNGFMFGEHGLIDKRCAYEASMRVPYLAHCPDLLPAGVENDSVVANIDIAPTVLAAAGLNAPDNMDGRSWLARVAAGQKSGEGEWRDALLYEYFWERNFPQTPTQHALRTAQYKLIRYHGVWDTGELYDMVNDPNETTNLIERPEHYERVKQMTDRLFDELAATNGQSMPFPRDRGHVHRLRNVDTTHGHDFPAWLYRTPGPTPARENRPQ